MSDIKFRQNVDFGLNELRNAKAHVVNGLPVASAGNAGYFVYNSQDGRFYHSTGSAWVMKATDSDLLQGQNGAYHLNRANHTGTQLAATISNFTAAVNALPWSGMAAPTVDVSLNTHKLTNVVDGTADSDAATFGQLKAMVNNQDFKASVRLVSTTNIAAITGLLVVDTVQTVAGDRVLLAGQTNPVQNGIYVVAAGAWTRAADADAVGELSGGTIIPVEDGSSGPTGNQDTLWMVTTNGAITPGVTSISLMKYGQSNGEIITAGAGLTKTGTTLDIGAGTGIIVSADSIALDPAYVLRKVAGFTGNGSASLNINHALGTTDVHVSVYEVATGDEVMVGITRVDANNVTLNFSAAPATSTTYKYVIFG